MGAVPGDLDFDVTVVGGERGLQAYLLPVGEVFLPGAQQVADPIQRIVSAAAVAVDVLLDPAADLIDRGRPELDHVELVAGEIASRTATASSSWARGRSAPLSGLDGAWDSP